MYTYRYAIVRPFVCRRSVVRGVHPPNSHGATLPPPVPLPLSALPLPFLPSHLQFPLPSSIPWPSFPSFLPLETGQLKSTWGRGWGSVASVPSGLWGGAPTEIEFGAF